MKAKPSISIDPAIVREALYLLAAKHLTEAADCLGHVITPTASKALIHKALGLIEQAEVRCKPMVRSKPRHFASPKDIMLIDAHGKQLKVGDQIGDRDGLCYQIDDIAPEENTVGVFEVGAHGPVKGVRPEAIGCKWQCRGA